MDPIWTPNGSQHDPKWAPALGSENDSKLGPPQGGQKVRFCCYLLHFGKVRALRKGSFLRPFLGPFLDPFRLQRAPEKHLKNRSKNDSILGPLLGPFWGPVGAQIGSIKGHIKPRGSRGPSEGLKSIILGPKIDVFGDCFLYVFERFLVLFFYHFAAHSVLEIIHLNQAQQGKLPVPLH